MRKDTTSIEDRLLLRIKRKGRGSVFSPKQFLDLGTRSAVDLALHRLVKRGAIRRISRGVYDYPDSHPFLGLLSPSVEEVARALAGKESARLQTTGSYAANLLGLTEQVPAKSVFLTDGRSRKVKVQGVTVEFRHASPRKMATAGKTIGTVIEALRALGKGRVTEHEVSHLRKTLPAVERSKFLEELEHAPIWMHPILRRVASEDNG